MKLQGFPERLAAFTQERREMPYAWGTNDCVTFPADTVIATAGFDPIAEIRGTWHDEASAQVVLQAQGGLMTAMDRIFFRRPMVTYYQKGDICLFKLNGEATLAVCLGAYAGAPGPDGMLLLPMDEARIVWEV